MFNVGSAGLHVSISGTLISKIDKTILGLHTCFIIYYTAVLLPLLLLLLSLLVVVVAVASVTLGKIETDVVVLVGEEEWE